MRNTHFTTKPALAIGVVLALVALAQLWWLDGVYLRHPGVYLDDAYRGLFFSSLQYAGPPLYWQTITGVYIMGALLLPLSLTLMVRHAYTGSAPRRYVGNHVDQRQFQRALRRCKQLARRTRWVIPLHDRNRLWCGVDLLTGEDVYLEGEDIFKGLVIIGAQGTGKTSRYFKVLMKQLAMDPAERTAFCVFTLKTEDSREFARFLRDLGKRVRDWAMCNVVDLCLSPTGGLQRDTLQAYLQGAALSTGLESRDPFWLNGSIARLVTHLLECRQHGQPATLGNAYTAFARATAQGGAEARMEQGLLETLKPALEAMADPASRVSVLHSPNHGGGLHFGPLFAAADQTIRVLGEDEPKTLTTSKRTRSLPHGLYEVPVDARLPFDWAQLLEATSVILPAPGRAKAELFALNFIKTSLLGWISADMARPDSRLLCRDPRDRLRIVLAQDEGHAFLCLDPPQGDAGFSDTRALAENRQAGQVSILVTQSLSRLSKSSKEKVDDFLSVNGHYFFLGVNGKEREKVLEVVGRVGVRRLEDSFSKQEGGPSTPGQPRRNSHSHSEAVREKEEPFIRAEWYGQFPGGMAIHVSQGKPHRLVYCPFHDQLDLRVRPPSLWRRLWTTLFTAASTRSNTSSTIPTTPCNPASPGASETSNADGSP